ncbi:PH domain-containing protein [Actinomadura harenae]|uniref:PH domain-containing protein n=1 Tax=Actinomadura harenae TaxID=2483351 RepID=A0A3M2M2R8_9ACTN|nr:PH domain-containing protein [Actinomadura harenae]RMI43093.1 PH domain-containing protein [Actinomadura harenae]
MSEDTQPAARWRVPPAQTAVKIAATAVLAALALLSLDDPQFLLLTGVAAVGAAALAVRDVLAPVRLEADADGLTAVRGYATRTRLEWPRVTAVRVDERKRLFSKTLLLEIETEDDLIMLSRFDLGADVRDVAETLTGLRDQATA